MEGWAFGVGLDRLAMVLHGIPDIRLLWSRDERFVSQFRRPPPPGGGAAVTRFVPFSKYPPVSKDLSAAADGAAPPTTAAADADDPWRAVENGVCEVVRAAAGDVAEAVTRVGGAYARGGRTSLCYRVTYRSMERSLTHAEVDALQARVRAGVVAAMGVTLR